MSPPAKQQCNQADLVCAYAFRAVAAGDAADVEAHLSECADCRQKIEALRPIVEAFTGWSTDVLRPSTTLWDRLVERIAQAEGKAISRSQQPWSEPEWEEVAPGISRQVLASNAEEDRVTLLVRLSPGVDYPPHRHTGVEELHLLQGELWIDGRKLCPGDYKRAEPGSVDHRVWTETGCTCLLITSLVDVPS